MPTLDEPKMAVVCIDAQRVDQPLIVFAAFMHRSKLGRVTQLHRVFFPEGGERIVAVVKYQQVGPLTAGFQTCDWSQAESVMLMHEGDEDDVAQLLEGGIRA